MTLQEILAQGKISDVIDELKDKSIELRPWVDLEKEYNVKKHPVYTDKSYVDVPNGDGNFDKVSRVGFDYQRLVTNRMVQLMFGLKVKRQYDLEKENETHLQIKDSIEKIFDSVRIDSENFERGEHYFKACEVATVWTATPKPNSLYGFDSKYKLKCRHFAPSLGDELYGLMDENDDMIAFSISYKRKKKDQVIEYFDTYTAEKHYRWKMEGSEWVQVFATPHTLGKIPVIYLWRALPIWGDTSENVYEIEWLLSREGNYSRKNAKPLLVVESDGDVQYGNEKPGTTEFRTIFQVKKGENVNYRVWESAVASNKFLKESIEQNNDKVLQIPDFSYENMKSKPLSGEAFKQMLIDAQLKVTQESGPWLKFFDREINIVKAYLAILKPEWRKEIERITIKAEITPFTVSEDKNLAEILDILVRAGIISKEAAAQIMNYVPDVAEDMEKIKQEKKEEQVEVEF